MTMDVIVGEEGVWPGNDFGEDEEVVTIDDAIYWGPSEVSKMVGISRNSLMYWVGTMGLKPGITKRWNKDYKFDKDGIKLMRKFAKLIEVGFSAKGAAQHIDKADKILKAIQ